VTFAESGQSGDQFALPKRCASSIARTYQASSGRGMSMRSRSTSMS
jgi:hypothetical protein